jgi:CubicO group peptidase (beta-lactamase class C family)
VNVDSPIAGYLPSTWIMPLIQRPTTFRHLLTHRSGYVGNNCNNADSLADLKTMVEHAPTGPTSAYGEFADTYSNCNYALMRVLIAYLVDGPQAYRSFESNPDTLARLTAVSYRTYVRGRLFAPIGLSDVEPFLATGAPTPFFHPGSATSCGNSSSTSPDDRTLAAGAGRWTLSAREYAWFLSNLSRGRIVSPASFDAMRAGPDNSHTFGLYKRNDVHGGKLYEQNGGGPCLSSSQVMMYPNGDVAMVISNTDVGPDLGALWSAFDNAVQ